MLKLIEELQKDREERNVRPTYVPAQLLFTETYIADEKANELSKDWGTDLYDKISDGFEATRETNEDMRKQADYQIEKLQSEIDDLKSEIKELECQLDAVS